jgi:FkbM family methyltransferase
VGPHGRVIALEPDRLNYSILLRNIERHNLTNVTPVKAALAGANGTAVFQAEGTIGSCLSSCSSRGSVGDTEIVETITLPEAFHRWGTPDFCKIDIEGAEIEVLNASRDLLRDCHTKFALDTNHVVNGSLTDKLVEEIFHDCGLWSRSERSSGTTWGGTQVAS